MDMDIVCNDTLHFTFKMIFANCSCYYLEKFVVIFQSRARKKNMIAISNGRGQSEYTEKWNWGIFIKNYFGVEHPVVRVILESIAQTAFRHTIN